MEATLSKDVLPRKDDKGKLDFTLLDDLDEALRQVVGVMQWAITEKSTPYPRGSFRGIHPDRYLAAMLRHYYSTGKDRKGLDHESKLLHLAHVATSALMALQNLFEDVQEEK